MPSRKLTGIIIRHMDLGELDRLYTIFTREEGVVECVARSVRKINSKLGSRLESFNLLDFQVAQNRGKWPIVISIDNCQMNGSGKDTFALFSLLCAAAEVTLFGYQKQDVDIDGFDLFKEAIGIIKADGNQYHLFAYTAKLLVHLGYIASPLQCARCNTHETSIRYFSAGALYCNKCGGGSCVLSQDSCRLLAYLLEHGLNEIDPWTDIKLTSSTNHHVEIIRNEVANTLKRLCEYHLEKRLKAWDLIQYTKQKAHGIASLA